MTFFPAMIQLPKDTVRVNLSLCVYLLTKVAADRCELWIELIDEKMVRIECDDSDDEWHDLNHIRAGSWGIHQTAWQAILAYQSMPLNQLCMLAQ